MVKKKKLTDKELMDLAQPDDICSECEMKEDEYPKTIDKSSKFYGEPLEFKEIDGWLWIKTDENHMERLPYEEYKWGKLTIKIKGSVSKYLRKKLSQKDVEKKED